MADEPRDTPNLTRNEVLKLALQNQIFVEAVKQFKAACASDTKSVTVIDDHNGGNTDFTVRDVIVVVKLSQDGSVVPSDESAVAQDGCTHLPVWVIPKYDETVTYQCKNPLYVAGDGRIHLSRMSSGSTLYFSDADKNFDTCVRVKREVYTTPVGRGRFEAHAWLTVPELISLVH